VVRAFVELRGLLSANKELATKVHALARKVSVHERNIAELADSMAELLAPQALTLALSAPGGFDNSSSEASISNAIA
jgi:hypothetical protein